MTGPPADTHVSAGGFLYSDAESGRSALIVVNIIFFVLIAHVGYGKILLFGIVQR